jgi:epoxyqueuosine reductase
LAHEAGFELAGIAVAAPLADFARYEAWVNAGMAGAMGYLTDHRGTLRSDPRNLLPSARSILCVGKLYNGPQPYSTAFRSDELGWISRYAWGDDYHTVLRRGLEAVANRLSDDIGSNFESRIAVDTAPLLERSLARQAGLGWIGKNTCLINQHAGSWFFLGELLLSLDLQPDTPPADRCGSCTRCIDACPTHAIVQSGNGWTLDSRLCISYLTIELRGEIEGSLAARSGSHLFGCDICQDVCPWNRRAAVTVDPAFTPQNFAPRLERMAGLTLSEFRTLFRQTPVSRTRYEGFLRNVAMAMGNSGNADFLPHLRRLAEHESPLVAEHARRALRHLQPEYESGTASPPVPSCG